MKRIFVFVAGCGLVVSIFYLLSQFGLIFECKMTELAARPSPNGNYIASIFRRDCGATTNVVSGIVMRSSGWTLLTNASDEVLIVEGEEKIDAQWRSDKELEIVIPSTADVFSRRNDWKGTRIVFSPARVRTH
jgi:hypothetical protein